MAGELFSKKNLVEAVLKEFEMTNKDATAIVDLMLDTVAKQLKKGNKVQLYGFGTFTVGKRAARKGRNPKTGDKVDVPPKRVPYFKPGKELKDLINRDTEEPPIDGPPAPPTDGLSGPL